MSEFLTAVKEYLVPYYYYIVVSICLVVFIIAGYYAYNKFVVDKHTSRKAKFNDAANSNMSDKEVVLYFFWVDWCPHCKSAKPEWQSFIESGYDGREIGDYVLKCKTVDCTNEDDPKVMEYINQFNISSFPNVKLVKDGTVIDFESKITENTLEQFVTTVLNE